MKWYHCLFLFLIVIIYLGLRLGWQDTIEFGYDQPLLAENVLGFIKNPSFINSYKFVGVNPWGYPSWGPTQIFFWIPFLSITKDPILISQLVAVFNLVGVIVIFLIGKRFFSIKIGIISSLLFATHPWSIIFSRMIYQPTPVLMLIPVSMFLNFYVLEKPKSKLLIPLIFSWGFIYQVYVHTFSFIISSFGLLIKNYKKASKKYFLVGVTISFTLFLPYIFQHFNYSNELIGLTKVFNKFNQLRGEKPYSIKDIGYEFLGTLGGGRLNWQLGYGYNDFIRRVPWVGTAEFMGIQVVAFVILYHLVKIIKGDGLRIKRIMLLVWTIGPVWFLALLSTPIALPRYFLVALPAFCLLFAIMADELSLNWVTLLISFWCVFLIIRYFNFIETYTYSRGFLSSYSDVPYSFLKRSFDWIETDVKNKGYKNFSVSSDFNYPMELRLNSAQTYYWYNILGKSNKNEVIDAYYLMYFSPVDINYSGSFVHFGPYIIYEVKN